MKPKRTWAVTRKLIGRYREQSTCVCATCLQAFPERQEIIARLKKSLKRTIGRDTGRET